MADVGEANQETAMETRALGKGGPQVPVLCLGTWPFGGRMGEASDEQAASVVRAALDVGMTIIDTAEGYLDSEARIGKAIRGRRQETFLATKLSTDDHSWDHMSQAIESSLRALGTDYVDLYQLHTYQAQWPLERTMGDLLRLRDAGKIRYIGVSNFSAEQTAEALSFGPVQSSQPQYNMLFRDVDESILPTCLENGVGVLPYEPLAKGLLTGRYRPGHRFPSEDHRSGSRFFQGASYQRIFEVTERLSRWAADHGRDIVQLAIAWTLAHPAVTSSIVGARTPEQVRHNAKAADWRLTETDLREIDEIQGDLRMHAPVPGGGP